MKYKLGLTTDLQERPFLELQSDQPLSVPAEGQFVMLPGSPVYQVRKVVHFFYRDAVGADTAAVLVVVTGPAHDLLGGDAVPWPW